MGQPEKNHQDALQKLRAERSATVELARQAIKEHSQLVGAIKAQLREGRKTVPEIAAATGIPASQALLYISGLRKYGQVAEAAKEVDYFKYELVKGGRS
ncbi:MAG: hypothetical protein M0017_09745 [Desulfobacteraceae bacterium]|nr:hypothetical protein [Desulfobacteraceae bacterium]